MARKREAEDREAAKAEGHDQSARESTNGKKSKSRHAAYRQSQDLSQSPGSFLRRLNGSRPQNGSASKPRPNGKNGKPPGAPPSGNRPINPFQYAHINLSDLSSNVQLAEETSRLAQMTWPRNDPKPDCCSLLGCLIEVCALIVHSYGFSWDAKRMLDQHGARLQHVQQYIA